MHVAETLIELGIFELIESSQDPISDQSIAEKLSIDMSLISASRRDHRSVCVIIDCPCTQAVY